MIRLFAGFDKRESIGFHVFAHSVLARSSKLVSVTPLAEMGLPQGSNAFTMSRFLVPWLCNFKGRAIFADGSDMICLADIAELDSLFDPSKAVQLVKRPDYETRNPRKYIGTCMECENKNYPRKNWASLMSIHCEHPAWQQCTPENLASAKPIDYLQFQWMKDEDIGELPATWNCLVDEGDPKGNILHWTAGVPAFDEYYDAPFAEVWRRERNNMERGK